MNYFLQIIGIATLSLSTFGQQKWIQNNNNSDFFQNKFQTEIQSAPSDSVKTKPFDIEPSMRLGYIKSFGMGDNILNNEFQNSNGFSIIFSAFSIYNAKFSAGFETQKFVEDASELEIYSHVNKNSYSLQIDYTIPIQNKFSLVPFINYGVVVVNFKDGKDLLARQTANELKIGTYLDYQFNSTYTAFVGLSYTNLFNDIQAPTPQDKKYYGTFQSVQLVLGFEFN